MSLIEKIWSLPFIAVGYAWGALWRAVRVAKAALETGSQLGAGDDT